MGIRKAGGLKVLQMMLASRQLEEQQVAMDALLVICRFDTHTVDGVTTQRIVSVFKHGPSRMQSVAGSLLGEVVQHAADKKFVDQGLVLTAVQIVTHGSVVAKVHSLDFLRLCIQKQDSCKHMLIQSGGI